MLALSKLLFFLMQLLFSSTKKTFVGSFYVCLKYELTCPLSAPHTFLTHTGQHPPPPPPHLEGVS